MSDYRRQSLIYEKEDLLIDGQGKYHGYNFYKIAGISIKGKGKGRGAEEKPPVDVRGLLP